MWNLWTKIGNKSDLKFAWSYKGRQSTQTISDVTHLALKDLEAKSTFGIPSFFHTLTIVVEVACLQNFTYGAITQKENWLFRNHDQMEAMSMQKEKSLVFLNFTFRHIFSQEFYWFFLLQIPEMESQPNPGPKIPQEDLDEEVQFIILWKHDVMYISDTNPNEYTGRVLGVGFPYSVL